MSHVLKVHLDKEPEFYTTEDVISGTLKLKVNKEIEVKDIQVKLQGHSNTRVTVYTYNHKNERRSDQRTESHEVFYDVITVFPPPNVRDAMKNNKSSFTLIPGEYSYPFKLKFSKASHCGDAKSKKSANLYTSHYETGVRRKMFSGSTYENNVKHGVFTLPPSLVGIPTDDGFNIRYTLKVSLHRANFFSVDTRMERQLTFFPRGPTSAQAAHIIKTCYFLYSDRITLDLPIPGKDKAHWFSSRPTHPVEFTLGVTTSQFLIPGTMPFSIHVLSNKDRSNFITPTQSGKVSMGQFYLTSLEIGLRNRAQLSASGNHTVQQFSTPVFSYSGKPLKIDLAKLKPSTIPSSQFEYDIDLTSILHDWQLPKMIPSFGICNGSIGQLLYVSASFSANSDFDPKRVTLTHSITVLGPIMERDDGPVLDYTAPPAEPAEPSESHIPPAFSEHETQSNAVEEELPTYQEATVNSLR